LDSMARLLRFMKGIGVNGINVLVVLGEANRLSDLEREQVVKQAVAAAQGLPVIVGASASGTRAACDLALMAKSNGATAVMVTPHAEPVPSEERVFEYFSAIGQAVDLPIVLQDHPASTGVHMPVPLILRIVQEVANIACLKEEAVPTPPKVRALNDGMKSRRVPVLTGLGALYGWFDLEAGSSGFNTGFAFPEVLIEMVRAARKRDWDRVRSIYTRFLPLIVFEQQPGVAVRKEILRRRGLISATRVRHPGAAIQPAVAEQLQRLLDAILPGEDLSTQLRV
ncbi:MAG: dihydrodipicolinate synthase family protein, partial [Burkholderiales bacterium]